MFQILFLYLRILQKLFCTIEPCITGIFCGCFAVFLINSASKCFRNNGIFIWQIVIVFIILIMLFQPSLFCLDNELHFLLFSCNIKSSISVRKLSRKREEEF